MNWRRVVNSDESRSVAVLEIMEDHPKVIIFYNFDYELDILKNLGYPDGTEVAEWNGHKHQEIPTGDKWVYLVQYTAGCEAGTALLLIRLSSTRRTIPIRSWFRLPDESTV